VILNILRILLLLALWGIALWFVLPVEWLQGSLFSLVALHAVPPLSIEAAWRLFKRVRRSAAEKEAGEHKSQQEAAQQEALAQRQAYLECRGVWAAVLETPDWHDDESEQVLFIEEDAKALREAGRADASLLSLEQVFAAAWEQCKICAWLPVILVADDSEHSGWIGRTWEQATESSVEQRPDDLDYLSLPGSGSLADRLITLFEDDPDLPAVLLLGMGSSLWEAGEKNPGHVVVLVLVNRPGLGIQDGVKPVSNVALDPNVHLDPMMRPYWERNMRREGASLWERIPLSLRRDLLSNCPPFATLHRPVTAALAPEMKRSARVQCIREALGEAFVNAASTGEPGWLVHDCGDVARFSALSVALGDCDCELNSIDEASNIRNRFGNVGAAREVLMLAVAQVRAKQLKKSVLLASLGKAEDGKMHIAVSRPCDDR
jgi:hypothetical protein